MKILLAENNDVQLRVLTKYLKMYNVMWTCTNNMPDVLDRATLGYYDAYLIDDRVMEEPDYDSVFELRCLCPRMPILLFGNPKIGVVEKYLDAGADDYIRLPLVYTEVVARLKSSLRRYDAGFQSDVIGNTTLDKKSHLLVANGLSVKVTGKEMRIMDLLIRERLDCVSSKRIFDVCWSENKRTKMQVVWVFIHQLRDKMEFISSDYYISSQKGFGYQLTPKKMGERK